MKKIILTCIAIIALFSLNSCDEQDAPIFVAQPDVDGIVFTNDFASNYLLSEETKENIADRFIWESADFGVPTNITYEIQGAISESFDEYDVIGSTSETNFPVLVNDLLGFARDLGLDDDPDTTNEDGSPNNVGQVYFRIKANTGTTGTNDTFSNVERMNITWVEKVATGTECASLYAVGAGLADIGWGFTPDSEMTCENDIVTGKFRFANDKFRLFQESGVWDPSYGFDYYTDEGYTIDPLLVDSNVYDADDTDDNFYFDGDPGIYTMTIDNKNRTIVLTLSSSLWAVGDAVPGGWGFDPDSTVEFIENTPDIWSASIPLTNGVFRFFQTFGVWDTNNNYAYYEDAGFTIDPNLESDGGDDSNFNFVGTPGTYLFTINAVEKTITLE